MFLHTETKAVFSVFFFSYRGGIDSEGRPVMVVVGAHFLLRCLDLERFVLYVVKVQISWTEFMFKISKLQEITHIVCEHANIKHIPLSHALLFSVVAINYSFLFSSIMLT
jgi:hypothetical protein